jgi:metal-responsive CopG/Arc/MetJ family transcriptional regulator
MATISFKIPEDLKREMDKYPQINWSEILRTLLQEKLKEMKRQRPIDRKKLQRAVESSNRLRSETPNWDSTEVVRFWREHR